MHNFNKEKYDRAKKRVDELKGFYIHLTIYVVINTFILINIYLNSDIFGNGSISSHWWLGVLDCFFMPPKPLDLIRF